jgi:FixJ family two-component response regulator
MTYSCSEGRPAVLPRKVILVVDDDPSFLRGIARLLKAHGFRTEAFDSVEDFHSRARLDTALCVVLDIQLNGKSGIELRRKLVVRGIDIPVIFITASDSEDTRRAAMKVSCTAYLVKPFPAKSLMEAIEKASAARREK